MTKSVADAVEVVVVIVVSTAVATAGRKAAAVVNPWRPRLPLHQRQAPQALLPAAATKTTAFGELLKRC
jgi:hypothetical protein